MARIRVVHWDADAGALLARVLRTAGFAVDFDAQIAPEILRCIREAPPDAIVIDLSRRPSMGREVAVALRGNKKTRNVPILFAGGDPEKVARVRQELPDAAYCELSGVVPSVRKCMLARPENPVVPTQMMQRYGGRTTAQKLGITAGMRVAVRNGPRNYGQVLGALPEGVEFDEESRVGCGVTVWFVESPEELGAALPEMRQAAAQSKLWIAWPKLAGRKDSRLSETVVRELGLAAGLVDYKICSMNAQWSGFCFAVRGGK